MKKIILATDFSDNAFNAITYAIDLFGLKDVSYLLLNTYYEIRTGTNIVVSMQDMLREESIKGLENEQKKLISKYGKELDIKSQTYYGSPSKAINTMAKEIEADIAIVGTKGSGGFENFIMGSNTLDAVKAAEVPLLVIPVNTEHDMPKNIALAADYKHLEDLSFLDPLRNLASDHNSTVHIVHVQESDDAADLDEAIEGLGFHYALEGVEHEFYTVKSSSIINGIDNFVQNNKMDLLTIIPRHHGFFERLFNKSVTVEMAKLADVPMLILREE